MKHNNSYSYYAAIAQFSFIDADPLHGFAPVALDCK
jgi:hypothetical protein